MDDYVSERAHALISRYEGLSEEAKQEARTVLAKQIDASHAWLDFAAHWFNKSDQDTPTIGGASVEVNCPCGKKLQLSI